MMKKRFVTSILIFASFLLSSQIKHALRDENGRHVIGRGFVAVSNNSKGASQLFIGANRYYPDGFSIVVNDTFVLSHNPLKAVGLEVFKHDKMTNPSDFIWDEQKQQVHILKWPTDNPDLHIRIIPGVNN